MVGTVQKFKKKLRGSFLRKKESAWELDDDPMQRKHTQDEAMRFDRNAALTETVSVTDDVEEMFYKGSSTASYAPQYRTTEQIRGNMTLYALHEDIETPFSVASFSQSSATTPSNYTASTPEDYGFSEMHPPTGKLPAVSKDLDLERLHSEVLEIKKEVSTIRREVVEELHVTRYDVLKELTLLKGAIAQLAFTNLQISSPSVSSTDSSSSDPLSSDDRAALTRQTPIKTSQTTRDRLTATRATSLRASARATSMRLTQLAPVADDALSTPLNPQQIDELFPLIDFTSELAAHAYGLTPGSRVWALTHVQEWLDARFQYGNDPLLAVVGESGSGKSAFCGTVAQQFRGNLLAVHCCQFDRKSKSSPRNVLLSVIHQILDNLPSFKNQLARLNLKYMLEEKDPFRLANKVLIDPLNALEEPTHSTLILVDGIDQCSVGANDHNELLEFFAQIIPQLPPWVGFLISSKPSSKLADRLPVSSVLEFSAKNEAFVADAATFVEDIAQYFSNDDAAEAKKLLKKKSGGNFAYLKFTKQALSHPGMAITSKDGVVPLSVVRELPETLYDIYAEIFEEKFGPNHGRVWDKAKPLLQLIVGAAAGPYSLVTEEQAKKQLDLTSEDLRMLRRSFADLVVVEHGAYRMESSALCAWLSNPNRSEEQFYFSIEDALLALRKMRLNCSTGSSFGNFGISSSENAPISARKLTRAKSHGILHSESHRHESVMKIEGCKPVGILKRGKL